MFFEGSEKKTEIIIDGDQLNLLTDVAFSFWSNLVKACNAQILSTIENEHCRAFLLSESSLFVWKNRLLIITCGETKLIYSALFFFEQYGTNIVKHLIYQRKNEYFAHAQSSYFGQDIKQLQQHIAGKAMRFGHLDSHHNYVFHQDNDYQADDNDKTYELLAYQISDHASTTLTNPNLSAQAIRDFLQLDKLIPNFTIDDFVFDPFGYSLNAIKDELYFTIHVTPQAGSSYISFESNMNFIDRAKVILSVLKPNSFDLLTFNENDIENLISANIDNCYVRQSTVCKTLDNGYFVNFANFILPQPQAISPVELAVLGENHAL